MPDPFLKRPTIDRRQCIGIAIWTAAISFFLTLVLSGCVFQVVHAQTPVSNAASVALIGDVLSAAYERRGERLELEADTTHTDKGWTSHVRTDYRNSWWVAGGELRNADALMHAGLSTAIPFGRADLSFTSKLGPRLAAETERRIGPIALTADAVWIPGEVDIRTGARWRWLEVSMWRVGGREWVPRLAVRAAW